MWPHHWGESGGHDVVVGARGISQTNDLKHGVRCPEAEARKSDECADTWVMVTRSADVTRHRTRHAPSPEHQGHFLRACWQNRLLPDRTTRRSGTTVNVTVVGTCPCYFRKGWQFFVAKICFLTTRLIYRMRRKGIGCINLSYEKKGHPLSTCFLTLGIFFTSLFDLINNSLLKKGKKKPRIGPQRTIGSKRTAVIGSTGGSIRGNVNGPINVRAAKLYWAQPSPRTPHPHIASSSKSGF